MQFRNGKYQLLDLWVPENAPIEAIEFDYNHLHYNTLRIQRTPDDLVVYFHDNKDWISPQQTALILDVLKSREGAYPAFQHWVKGDATPWEVRALEATFSTRYAGVNFLKHHNMVLESQTLLETPFAMVDTADIGKVVLAALAEKQSCTLYTHVPYLTDNVYADTIIPKAFKGYTVTAQKDGINRVQITFADKKSRNMFYTVNQRFFDRLRGEGDNVIDPLVGSSLSGYSIDVTIAPHQEGLARICLALDESFPKKMMTPSSRVSGSSPVIAASPTRTATVTHGGAGGGV